MPEEQTLHDDMPDGIYFDLDEDQYHHLQRLSASGIKNMDVSPATFWARSWLNPNKEPFDTDTKALLIGRAYHCARLEPEKFEGLYCREPSKDDLSEDALCTDTAIKGKLKEMGLPQSVPGENVLNRAKRLRAEGYPGDIWHLYEADYLAANSDRTPIPAKPWDDMTRDLEAIQSLPEITELLSGGQAEVTVLWTSEGVKMKSRLDYLRPSGWTDFKTFDNSRGKEVRAAISDAFRYNRYFIQAVVYIEAFLAIRNGLLIQGEKTPEQLELVKAIQTAETGPESWFVFQEKGGIPNIFARKFMASHVDLSIEAAAPSDGALTDLIQKYGSPTLIFEKGVYAVKAARRTFQTMQEIYQPGQPWHPTRMLGTINDDDFNDYWLRSDI